VVGEKCFVEMVAVDVRDIEIVGVLYCSSDVACELVVAREGKPRTEKCRLKPWVTQDGDVA
jgi:hypothetical protein